MLTVTMKDGGAGQSRRSKEELPLYVIADWDDEGSSDLSTAHRL